MSVKDDDVVCIDFSANLGTSTITGTPTINGVNCSAALFGTPTGGLVQAKVSGITGTGYKGAVEMSIDLADGRHIERQIDLRFIGPQQATPS